MILPEVQRIELAIERAKQTWIAWESTSKDPEKQMDQPCTPENVEILFRKFYDEYASPILERFQEMLDGEEGEDEESSSKN